MNTRLIPAFAFAVLAALLVATQAGAMTMRANAALSGEYLYLDQSKVIAWDAVGATVTTVRNVDPWTPIEMTSAFTCAEPVDCVEKAGTCDWTGETDDGVSPDGPIPEWWETTPSEADLRWGVCTIASIRENDQGDVIAQYRAGLRATSKVPTLAGKASMVSGTWITEWSIYWVDDMGQEIVELDRIVDQERPAMCKVNPLGNPDEYEGFRDPLNQLDFATCVWDPSRTVNISAAYEGADPLYKPLIVGFEVRGVLDNLDDGQQPWDVPASCPCGLD